MTSGSFNRARKTPKKVTLLSVMRRQKSGKRNSRQDFLHHLIVSRRGEINDEDAHENLAIDEVIFQTIIYAAVIYKFTKN